MALDKELHRSGRWFEAKAAEIPLVGQSAVINTTVSWADPTFNHLTREGYQSNAAVFACINALAFACQEPRPIVESLSGEPLPNHPLQALLNRPNPKMSWAELALYIATYKAIGGQCFLHKVGGARTTELYPYHMGQLTPEPSRTEWISGYIAWKGTPDERRIPAEDIIHLKWPSVDPLQPWLALPPLRAIAREVDTDSEATRYLFALLANDATPRTVINLTKDYLDDSERQHLREAFGRDHGGMNRGGIAITTGGASVDRLALNLQELAFDALRKVPEARICTAFRVPPEYLGLTVGLEQSTYNNKNEARRGFIEDTIVQLLNLDANELTADLASEFGAVRVAFDYSEVVGLGENQNEVAERASKLWTAGIMTLNETRQSLGLPPAEDVVPDVDGNVFKTEPAPAALPAPIDVTPNPRQLTVENEAEDEAEELTEEQAAKIRRQALIGLKQLSTFTERRMAYDIEQYLRNQVQRAVDAAKE